MKTLIDHVTVLSMDSQGHVYPDGYVLFDEEGILDVGEGGCRPEADVRVDGHQGILMPGMINIHSHIPMAPFRSMGDDCPDRLKRFLFPLEREAMTPELVYVSSRYAVCELLLSGVTSVLDMYYFEGQVAKACDQLGIRAWVGQTVIGQGTCDSRWPYGGLALCEELIRAWRGHGRIHPLVAPHATNTNSPEKLKEAYRLAEEYGVLFTLHASEMDYEMGHFRERYQQTPIGFLDSLGVLGPQTIAAHCIHITGQDIRLLAESKTKVAHCPGSNTKAGKGVSPVYELRQAGVDVGVGSDGPSSGNTLDLFTQFKMIACLQKTKYHDRGIFPAKEIVMMGTMGGARALGAEKEIGSLEPGKQADMVLLETGSANMFPIYNPYSAVVYSANASNVDSVWVGGRQLVAGGRLTHTDLQKERESLSKAMGAFKAMAQKYADII